MKKRIIIELQVSPWQVFHDSVPQQYTITKKISCFSPQNINRFRPTIKKVRTPHEKINQLLMVFEKPKQIIKQHTQQMRKQDNSSVLKRLKQRLNAVILQEWQGQEDERNQKIKRMISQKQIKSVKQTPKQSRQNNKQDLFNSLRRKNRKAINRIENCDNQIFIRRQMHSIKSNQKLKSNKQLILPKIRLCTIQ